MSLFVVVLKKNVIGRNNWRYYESMIADFEVLKVTSNPVGNLNPSALLLTPCLALCSEFSYLEKSI